MNKADKVSILHIIDTTGPGGAETIFLNLAEIKVSENIRNIALIKGPGWVEDQLINKSIPYFVMQPHGFLSLPYYFNLIRFIKKQKVVLIQAHLLGSILTASIICLICRIPLVATLHGLVDISPKEKFLFFKRLLISAGVSRLIAVSKSLADFISCQGLFTHKKIDIIYNGVDTGRYYKSTQGYIRSQLGLEAGSIIVGSLGNIRPAKNYDILIKAAAILKKSRGDNRVHFLIAGHKRKDIIERLERLAIEEDITSNVHFLGFLDDTPRFLSELDIFLLCSSSEGFSIATIEAMATGIPIVATRCGGPEEIIKDNENGLLIEKNDPKAIANTISKLLKNNTFAETLSCAAKKHVFSTFSLDTMFAKYNSIYNELLKSKLYNI